MLRPPQAFLFDLDGTLVDTVGTRVEAWMETFPHFGIEPDPAFLAPLMGSDGRLLARKVAEHAGVPLEPGTDAEIDRVAGERFGELNTHPRALPAVTEILARLDAAGLPWAVATSSRPDEARASVRALDLPRWPLIVDGQDVEHSKPAPDLLLKAAHELGVAAEDTWYVGDSKWDMLAADAAGMLAIGVSTGATSSAELDAAGAVASFADLGELIGYLTASGYLAPVSEASSGTDGSPSGSTRDSSAS